MAQVYATTRPRRGAKRPRFQRPRGDVILIGEGENEKSSTPRRPASSSASETSTVDSSSFSSLMFSRRADEVDLPNCRSSSIAQRDCLGSDRLSISFTRNDETDFSRPWYGPYVTATCVMCADCSVTETLGHEANEVRLLRLVVGWK